ncbi:MAG: DUF1697 domain-containing protein [Proteobacteria bacterium]|nr:DUF1697 domain-containing protein [Pseudomonadota bacterium]
MPRFVAFLRGVSPMNAKMPELKKCFEAAGFTNVRTVLSSGNVVFDARARSESALERKCEAAMHEALGRSFFTFVRPVSHLRELLATDPFAVHGVPAKAKRVVSFLRDARAPKVALPLAQHESAVLCMVGREVFSAYVPTDNGPVFMRLIETTFGKDITTRTWDTVAKCAAA